MMLTVCWQKQPSSSNVFPVGSVLLAHMAVSTNFQRSGAQASLAECTERQLLQPTSICRFSCPGRAQCSYRSLRVPPRGQCQDTQARAPSSLEPHSPFAVVMHLRGLFPSSATRPLLLSKNSTCEFTNDFWLPNAAGSCQSLIIAVTSLLCTFPSPLVDCELSQS